MDDPAAAVLAASPTPLSPRSTMRRLKRSSSPSPSRLRLGDELLSRLSPVSAVEALRAPSGALKTCLDNASTFEQSSAMRAAVTSHKIHDWLDELSDWPWPCAAGSAGFEMPPTKRRKLSDPSQSPTEPTGEEPSIQSDTEYIGSLPAENVARYEKRVQQIRRDMDELKLEEIKSQVLHNHIMPLSQPGTPTSSPGRSSALAGMAYNKLEDLAAVITAITVQALPNLAKLTRLLNVWSVRLAVLRRIPPLLNMIQDAEIGLRSGWSAINPPEKPRQETQARAEPEEEKAPTLTRKDFEVMDQVLQQKVSQPGRDADVMLDFLEGMADTLPDKWLDRLEALEKDYVNWVSTAKLRVLEAEWTDIYGPALTRRPSVQPDTPKPKIHIQTASPTREAFDASEVNSSPPHLFNTSSVVDEDSQIPSMDGQADSEPKANNLQVLVDVPSEDIEQSTSQVLDLSDLAAHQRDVDSGAVIKNPSLNYDSPRDERPRSQGDRPEPNGSAGRPSPPRAPRPSDSSVKASPPFDASRPFLEAVVEEGEDSEQLLPSPQIRSRKARGSMASTVVNGRSRATSADEFPRLADLEETFSSDAMSPPSSPRLRCASGPTSAPYRAPPGMGPQYDEDDTPPRSPLQPPSVFDADSSVEYGSAVSSPSRASVTSHREVGGDQLHKRLSKVLGSIPGNRFSITNKVHGVDLNPPDIQLPSRARPRTSDPFRRSESAMSARSSRAGTPAFLLAPAKTARPRSRNSNDARPYFLCRGRDEPPMKLLIRCVGENGERVMVRVGGGWADLGEYLKEYAVHHGRRSKGEGRVEVKGVPTSGSNSSNAGSSPPERSQSRAQSRAQSRGASRSRSSLGMTRPDETPPPLPTARQTRKSMGEEGSSRMSRPRTPHSRATRRAETPSSERSSSSSARTRGESPWEHSRSRRGGGNEEGAPLGMSGPRSKYEDRMTDENKLWVEDVAAKVRSASGERRQVDDLKADGRVGEMSRIGGTQRLYRKGI